MPSPPSILFPTPRSLRGEAAALLRSVLLHLAGGGALLALMTAGYIAKRALGLDLLPGLDVLPDAEIEDALHLLARLVGD